MSEKLQMQAKSEEGWPFEFYIEKAQASDDEGDELSIQGVASTLNVDHDNERMAEDALRSMAKIINSEGVPLRWEHQKGGKAVIGNVNKAWIDSRKKLWIKAILDKSHPAGPMLHDKLKNGGKYGLSVGGRVKNALRELAEGKGMYVKTFYDVLLDEVSVTEKPSNFDAWLDPLAKSIGTPEEKEAMVREFIFENRSTDYLYQFAKSVPNKSWTSVDLSKTSDTQMEDKDKEKKEKGAQEEEQDKVKSFVSKGEFSTFASNMEKAIMGLTKAITKGMGVDAMDTTNPDKKKDEVIGDEMNKDGMDTDAHDQDSPSKDKEENVGDNPEKTQKAGDRDGQENEGEEANGSDENGEREKSEDSEDDEKKEKSEDDEDEDKKEKSEEDKEEEYDSEKSMTVALKAIEKLSKAISAPVLKKNRKSGVSDLDAFAMAVSEFADGAVERLEKSGRSIPGLANSIADFIKNDPESQAEIRKAIRQVGPKKSMATGGVPFMVTKDGRRFALTATPIGEEVKKSANGKALSFKQMWQSEYSPTPQSE